MHAWLHTCLLLTDAVDACRSNADKSYTDKSNLDPDINIWTHIAKFATLLYATRLLSSAVQKQYHALLHTDPENKNTATRAPKLPCSLIAIRKRAFTVYRYATSSASL